MTTILGIDPGSLRTGYGVIETGQGPRRDRLRSLAHGVISVPASLGFNDRLRMISDELQGVIAHHQPQVAVVERIFLGRNADSAFKLGHVRGVCLLAASQSRCEIVEYAARSVKKGITGSGAASKEQVQAVLFALLGLRQPAVVDASDALALAYFHAQNLDVAARWARQSPGSVPGRCPDDAM